MTNNTPKKIARLLVTRPEHDPGTRYLSAWAKKIISVAEKKGFDIVDLHQTKAKRKEFEGRIKKTNPSLIFLNGHGNDESVTGHDNEVLVKTNENENLLKNKVTYAVSCDSAKVLGKKCADGNTAYIGYKESFIVNLERKYLNRPLQDKRAKRFLDPSNQIPLSLIKGHSAKEASDRSKSAFKREIIALLTSIHKDASSIEDAKDLWWNMTHQVCLGAEDATI